MQLNYNTVSDATNISCCIRIIYFCKHYYSEIRLFFIAVVSVAVCCGSIVCRGFISEFRLSGFSDN